jgi:NAD(P)-dependent dehydrogenase (short-subunit alcohol dehydrogenase family)
MTRAIAEDLERRGFIVYVVVQSAEEEHTIQMQNRSDIRALHLDLTIVSGFVYSGMNVRLTVTDTLDTVRDSSCATRHLFPHIATAISGAWHPASYVPAKRADYTPFFELPHRTYTNNHSIQLGRHNQHTTPITYINNTIIHPSSHTPKS